MSMHRFALTLGFLSFATSAVAQTLTLPPKTTGLTPLEGKVTNVQAVRVPLGEAVTGSETRVTLQFRLQGCLDSLLPLIAKPEIQEDRVTFYVTALNAHNQDSIAATCMAMPQATRQVTVPGLFQRNQVRVVFMGRSPQVTQPKQKTYTHPRLGFSFRYPAQLALDKTAERQPLRPRETEISHLALWPQEVYQAIQAGQYEGGTEYPPGITVSVHRNPQKQSLINWAQRYQPGVQNVKPTQVSGQAGIAYTADGLYPSDNVAFYSPQGQIILLSVSFLDPQEAPLRSAFEEIVASFRFN